MTDRPKKGQPRLSAGGEQAQAARRARQAAALRANLQRRKAQARGQADSAAAGKDSGREKGDDGQ